MDSYRKHVERLEREVGDVVEAAAIDALIIHSGSEQPRSPFDDQMFPFRATPAFAHWLPLEAPGCALEIRPGQRPRLFWPQPESFWEAAPPRPEDWVLDRFEVEERAIEVGSGRLAFVGDDPEAAARLGIDAAAVNPASITGALDRVRAIKSDYEIECIAEANRAAARGHAALLEAFAGGDASELELHLRYLEATGQDDADTPYKNIVARGRNAAVLHHVRYDGRRPEAGAASLLVDAGARFGGYAADVTRTQVKTGRDPAALRFADLIDGLDRLQRELCSRVRPGLAYESLHDQAHELLAALLIEAGLARGSAEALVETGVTRALFPHGLGHSLGIQVHDVGCREREPAARNPFLRNTSEITAGQVFTIEPGCYFIDSLLEPLRHQPAGEALDWNAVAALHSFGGIRIEDNLAVTPDGSRNLTRDNWPGKP